MRHWSVDILGKRCEVVAQTFGTERFDRHFHDAFSIGLVRSGTNAFGYRGRMVEAPAGSVCVADPGEVHDGGRSGASWSYTNLFAPYGLIAGLLAEQGFANQAATASGVCAEPELVQAMQGLFACLADPTDGNGLDDVATVALTRLFEVNGAAPAGAEPPNDGVARRALDAIRDANGVGLSLDALSAEAGASRYRVVRSVQRAIGLTPMTYALQLRVYEAKRLIGGGMPLAEAAIAAGFSDQAHMTRRMKRVLGVTPGTVAVDRHRPGRTPV